MKNIQKCSIDSWVPRQIKTSLKLLKSTDYYEQAGLKFSGVGQFHSRAELLHAALLEGDPKVKRYTPQPFRFRIGSKWYIPDCYVELDKKIIRELKPNGRFDEDLQELLGTFCSLRNIKFETLSNEQVFQQECLAENWLTIIRLLSWARDVDSDEKEKEIIESMLSNPSFCLGDVVDISDRKRTYISEIAIFRLLHRGILNADLVTKRLSFDTEFELV